MVWLPELGGPADPELTAHDELMVLLGILAKREVTRARIRARTAMTVQARDQGRYLGGRPPYGYRLVDAGPHPNRALARRGVRLRALAIDPATGPIVQWMFTQRLAGHSKARITRALNDAGIPSPGMTDPDRNPHRHGTHWTLGAVRAILANPRYTGRQIWNRQRTDHVLVDPQNTTLGERDVMRWNPRDAWVISQQPAHPALVSETDFVHAQAIHVALQVPEHVYQLTGLLTCAVCGRRMASCWSHGHPAYRCRHGHSSAAPPDPARPVTPTSARRRCGRRCPPCTCASPAHRKRRAPTRRPSTCARTGSGSSSTRQITPSPPRPRERSACTSADLRERYTRRGEADSEKHPPRLQAEIGCRSMLPGNRAACTQGVSEGGLEPPRPIKGTSTSS